MAANLLEELIAKLTANSGAYTPLTDAQMEEKARQRYQSLYDQNRLSAQQQYDAEKLARDQALQTQLEQYDLQREQSAENYRRQQEDAIRSALGRGMQRSSYLNATVGNIGIKGNEAQQAILKNQQGTVKNYAAQQQLAASQLAGQMAQYDKAQLADQLAYQDELEAREYDRAQSAADRANQIASDIYGYQVDAIQNNLFGMGDLYRGSSGGGSSSSSGRRSSGIGTSPAPTATSAFDNLLSSLSETEKKVNIGKGKASGVVNINQKK